jgi:methylamine dehydrogenase light chain
MKTLDRLFENSARSLAKRTSRRSLLASLGQILTGVALMPLLPIDRTARAQEPARPSANEQQCEYWKYCAIDGFLCACHNPGDGRDYIISYNDCCGKVSCGDCFCDRNEGEKPMYRLSRNNDVNWCMANSESNYHCSVSVILGVAEK